MSSSTSNGSCIQSIEGWNVVSNLLWILLAFLERKATRNCNLAMSSTERLGSMVGGIWWWKQSRWMGDEGAWCGTSASTSSWDSALFFFLRWITYFLKLFSNWLTMDVWLRTSGMSPGWESSVASAIEDCSLTRLLVLWASLLSHLLVWGWVREGIACCVGFTFFTWGVGVSSKRGATFLYVSWTPSHLYHHQSHWAHVIILQWTMVVAS